LLERFQSKSQSQSKPSLDVRSGRSDLKREVTSVVNAASPSLSPGASSSSFTEANLSYEPVSSSQAMWLWAYIKEYGKYNWSYPLAALQEVSWNIEEYTASGAKQTATAALRDTSLDDVLSSAQKECSLNMYVLQLPLFSLCQINQNIGV
jgi:hypothetical protein